MSVCAKLFKNDIIKNITFPEGKINEDVAVITDILESAKTISCIYLCNYYYRVNYSSITNTKFSERNMDIIYFLEGIINHFKDDLELKKSAINMFFRRNVELLSKYYAAKYKDSEIEKVLKSNIKKYRKLILFDRYSKISSKVSAFASYVSIHFVVKMRNFLKKY